MTFTATVGHGKNAQSYILSKMGNPAPASDADGSLYTVKKGDTMSEIWANQAKDSGVSYGAFKEANSHIFGQQHKGNLIWPGDKVVIPSGVEGVDKDGMTNAPTTVAGNERSLDANPGQKVDGGNYYNPVTRSFQVRGGNNNANASTDVANASTDVANNATHVANSSTNVVANAPTNVANSSTNVTANASTDVANNATHVANSSTNVVANASTNVANSSTNVTANASTDVANDATHVANGSTNVVANSSTNVANSSTNVTANGSTNVANDATHVANSSASVANGSTNVTANGSTDVANDAIHVANGSTNVTANGSTNASANGSTNVANNSTNVANDPAVTTNAATAITSNGNYSNVELTKGMKRTGTSMYSDNFSVSSATGSEGRVAAGDVIKWTDADGNARTKTLTEKDALGFNHRSAVVDTALDEPNWKFHGHPVPQLRDSRGRKVKENDFWRIEKNVNGVEVMQLKDGVKPSDAVRDIYENQDHYRFDCAAGVRMINMKATLDTVGDRNFDNAHRGMSIRGHFDSTDGNTDGGQWRTTAYVPQTNPGAATPEYGRFDPNSGDKLVAGEWRYYENPGDTRTANQGWNAIYLGKNERGNDQFWRLGDTFIDRNLGANNGRISNDYLAGLRGETDVEALYRMVQ